MFYESIPTLQKCFPTPPSLDADTGLFSRRGGDFLSRFITDN